MWNELGPYTIDLMASTVSAQRIPQGARTLPFFSQYDCAGSSGVDVFAQDVSRVPGTGEPVFGLCFPTPGYGRTHCTALSTVYGAHGACHALHTIVLVPLVPGATVRSLEVAPQTAGGYFSVSALTGRFTIGGSPNGRSGRTR